LLGGVLLVTAVVAGSSGVPRAPPSRPAATGVLAARSSLAVLHSTPTDAFVDPRGRPVRLVGLNVVPVWRNDPGRTWPLEDYRRIRGMGFNVVRLVLYWDDFEPGRGDWDHVSLSTLDTAVGRAGAAGLYVILDAIHLVGPGGFDRVPGWARMGDSVTTIELNGAGYLRLLANRYRAEPAVAAFDPVNEFHRWPLDQDSVLQAYDRLIGQIRLVDSKRIVLVQPSYGDTSVVGQLPGLANLSRKANVVWSVHDYFAGGDDDGYGANGAQVGTYTWDGRTGYPAPDPAALERHLLVQLETARAAGLPMWIGEFGIGERTVNHDRWIDDQVRIFERHRIGWAWWQYAGSGSFSALRADARWKLWVRRLVRQRP
jgi:Cellulase (glycosyl hydrolase family 5)